MVRIALIDDDVFVGQAWARELGRECEVWVFGGAAQFWRAVEAEPGFLESLDCVLVDFFLGEGDPTGVQIARDIRAKSPCPILACTSAELSEDEASVFSGVTDKEPKPLSALAMSLVRGWSHFSVPVRTAESSFL